MPSNTIAISLSKEDAAYLEEKKNQKQKYAVTVRRALQALRIMEQTDPKFAMSDKTSLSSNE